MGGSDHLRAEQHSAPNSGSLLGNGHAERGDPSPSAVPDALAVDIRHDVRHAASTILLLLATLRGKEFDATTLSAFDGIAHLARSVSEMAGRDDAPPEPIDVDVLTRRAARRAGLLYSGTIEVDVEPARVFATRMDISRLLANLIENSCRAAGPAGTVELAVRADDGWCTLAVGDSGAGFSQNPTGTGIGLSAITAIAERLKGYVTFGRSHLGGALATVHLPGYDGFTVVDNEQA
jgi:signal transduction histidine kinase